ncbi:MAG TPA: hypothetical protein PLB45_04890 [Bacilli bacterium]|nr:hypothetical protein [Bacilli bacterium]HQC84183.1 hypothetical protein [Bacilli bacterium]
MILRKPYAFIIKHFRLIHLAILGTLIFILMRINDLSSLFNTLLNSRTYTYAGADVYLNSPIYLFIFIGLGLSAVVYWLLKEKKKPSNLYLFLIIYYFIAIIGFLYFNSILKTLINDSLNVDTLRLCRDLAFLLSAPGYIFSCICFVRGIGFNLKQFNFSKDIAELKIADNDSAEFELLVGQNNYKYMRWFRRARRELKYYILENKVAISIAGFVVLLILGFLGYRYYDSYMKAIKASQVATVNGISYVVNGSYITDRDINGNVVKDGSKFVVVNMSFNNTLNKEQALNLDIITLTYGELSYKPTLSYNSKFYDLGVPYKEAQVIPSSSMLDATLTFEIPSTMNVTNFTLKVRYGLENKSDSVISKYRLFTVNAKEIDAPDVISTVNLNTAINTNIINNNEFDLNIIGYKITDSYNYKYVICSSSLTCSTYSSLITSNKYDLSTMLVLDYDGKIYDNAYFTKSLNTYNKIFESYCTIYYDYKNVSYSSKAKVVYDSDVDGKVFLYIDRKIALADNISLRLDFRNYKYTIKLK